MQDHFYYPAHFLGSRRCPTKKDIKMKSIVLGGFMGCGKTRIGKLLSEKTGFTFVDTDDYVKNMAGISIHDMLMEGRVADVREYERRTVEELSGQKNTIVATGGGVLIKDENGRTFHEKCHIVYLKRNFDTVYPIISKDPVRVLAYGKSYEDLKKLHDERIPLYSKYADLIIDNDKDPEACADAILERFSKD